MILFTTVTFRWPKVFWMPAWWMSCFWFLPEALRSFADYRMLIYAVVLILVMLGTNSPQLKGLLKKLVPGKKGEEV